MGPAAPPPEARAAAKDEDGASATTMPTTTTTAPASALAARAGGRREDAAADADADADAEGRAEKNDEEEAAGDEEEADEDGDRKEGEEDRARAAADHAAAAAAPANGSDLRKKKKAAAVPGKKKTAGEADRKAKAETKPALRDEKVATDAAVAAESDATQTVAATAAASSKRGPRGDLASANASAHGTKQPQMGLDKKRRVTAEDLLAQTDEGTVPPNVTPPPASALPSPSNPPKPTTAQTRPVAAQQVARTEASRLCCPLGQVTAWWEPLRRIEVSIEGASDAGLEREARILLSMAGIVETLQLREADEGLAGHAVMSRVSEAILAAEICHQQHLAHGEAEILVTWAQGHEINAEDLNRVIVTFGNEDPGISLDWVTDNLGEATGRNQAIEDRVFHRFSHLGAIGSVRTLIANSEVPNEQDVNGVAVITFMKPSAALRAVEDWAVRGPCLTQAPVIRCLHGIGDLLLAGIGAEDVPQQHAKLAPLNKRTRSASPVCGGGGGGGGGGGHYAAAPFAGRAHGVHGVDFRDQTIEYSLHQPKRSKAAVSSAARKPEVADHPLASSRTLRIVNVSASSRDAVQEFVANLPGLEFIELPPPDSGETSGTARFSSTAAAESAARSLDELKLEDARGNAVVLEWTPEDPLRQDPGAGLASDTRKRRTKERENEGECEREQPAPKHQATEAGQTTRRPRSDFVAATAPGEEDASRESARILGSSVARSFSTSSLRRGRPRPASTGRDNARRRAELERELELEAAQRKTNDDNADRLADNFRSAVAFSSSASTSSSSPSLSPSSARGRRGSANSFTRHPHSDNAADANGAGRHRSSSRDSSRRRKGSDPSEGPQPGGGALVAAPGSHYLEDAAQRYDPGLQYAAAAAASMHHPHIFHSHHAQQPVHASPGYPGFHPAANMPGHPQMMGHPSAQGPSAGPAHYYVPPPGHPHGTPPMYNPGMPTWPPPLYGPTPQGLPGYAPQSGPYTHMTQGSPAISSVTPSVPSTPPSSQRAEMHAFSPSVHGEDVGVDAHSAMTNGTDYPSGTPVRANSHAASGNGGGSGTRNSNSRGAAASGGGAGGPASGPSASNGRHRDRKDRSGHVPGASTGSGNGIGPGGSVASAPLETSRLYVSFSRPLPEDVLKEKFEQAAPGLEYVSRHTNKCFAFVKYSAEDAAKLAMWRLNGAEVLGQALRVSIAQPPRAGPGSHGPGSATSSSRKRQRTFDPDQHRK